MKKSLCFSLLVLLSGLLPFSCLAAATYSPNEGPHVRGELIASVASIAPGDRFTVVFRQEIDPGWHTYWLNPGDSGAPPDISWSAQPGISVGEFAYPWPERIAYGPLMNFGYHDEVLLPFTVAVDETYSGSEVSLTGNGRVLVCADICIPEKITLELQIPIGATVADDAGVAVFAKAQAKLPVPLSIAGSYSVSGEDITLTIGLPFVEANRISSLEYFPLAADVINNAASQTFSMTRAGLQITLESGFAFDPATSDLSGLLVVHEAAGAGITSGYEVTVTAAGSAAQDAGGTSVSNLDDQSSVGFWSALLLAFLGGLILNLMPCVFPVLSIKILSLVDAVHTGGGSMRLHGLAYAGGVVASFVAIAVVLVLLRASGEVLGWGFQLQSPIVVTLLAYLFLVIGLNLLGMFEIGGSLMSLGGQGDSQGYLGSASTGVLATLVAAPCTAPFMGAAVGYALIQSPIIGILVFASLGFGMAVPYLLLCYSPGLLARLPRPGSWMLVLRQLMAFPMLASAIWLVWVLGIQSGVTAMMQVLGGGLLIAFGIWTLLQKPGSSMALPVRFLGLLLLAVALYIAMTQTPASRELNNGSAGGTSTSAAGLTTVDYSSETLQEALAQGPVFVNFTAAWCITCKVNELNALSSEAVASAFREAGVTYLKADWTNEDPRITTALQAYGRSGVPLYLLYEAGAERATVLPQILTESMVLDAIGSL